jgi:flagellar hook-associated protein 3 FlgL
MIETWALSSLGQARRGQLTTRNLQAELNKLGVEMSSGKKADVTFSLGATTTVLVASRNALRDSRTFQETIDTIDNRMELMQDSMNKAMKLGNEMKDYVLQATGSPDTTYPRYVRMKAEAALDQIKQYLNAEVAGRQLFSGVAIDTTPMERTGAGNTIMQTVVNNYMTTATITQITTTAEIDALITGADGINSVFDDTHTVVANRYQGNIYLGADSTTQNLSAVIDDGTRLQYGVKGSDQVIRDVVQGLQMLAAVDYQDPRMTNEMWRYWVDEANERLMTGLTSLNDTIARTGLRQKIASDTKVDQEGVETILNNRIAGFEVADPREVSIKFASYEKQLDASYAVASRLAQLSLTKYMQ